MEKKKKQIHSIDHLITTISGVIKDWEKSVGGSIRPWFRGEPDNYPIPVIPKLYRNGEIKPGEELKYLSHFRMRAPNLVDIQIPQQGHTDQWLFLAQHVGLPTRLLDWSEGLLIALFFALNPTDEKHLKREEAVIWMLNPDRLNLLACGQTNFPPTWFAPELDLTKWIRNILEPDNRANSDHSNHLKKMIVNLNSVKIPYNYANINIRSAWENGKVGTELPIAIHPTYIHPRISAQLSRFTIWGSNKKCLKDMVGDDVIREYSINKQYFHDMKRDLRLLGITHTTLFSDLDGLARDIKEEILES